MTNIDIIDGNLINIEEDHYIINKSFQESKLELTKPLIIGFILNHFNKKNRLPPTKSKMRQITNYILINNNCIEKAVMSYL